MKDVENRDWRTNYRGPIAIHATKKKCSINGLDYGGLIGMVYLIDVVEHLESRWFTGRYGWVLSKPIALPFHPITGRQRIFNIDVPPLLVPKPYRYHHNWKRMSYDVRKAARWQCQGTPNFPDCLATHNYPHPETESLVCLTVAHMNHDSTDNRPNNLRALCQRCHLNWDAQQHAKSRNLNKRWMEERQQIPLF